MGSAQAQSQPNSATASLNQRASLCVAALQADVLTLKGRYQAGETTVKPQMVTLTRQGFAFVGTAYLRGLRKAEADQLLERAEAKVAALPKAELASLSANCQNEGERLYREANAIERALVANRAQARVDKLLR